MLTESELYHADIAKQYLLKVRNAKLRLDQMEERRMEQERRMQPRGTRLTGMPRNPNAYADAIPDGMNRLQALDDVIDRYTVEWGELMAEATAALLAMPSYEHQALLEAKYLDGLTWNAIPQRVMKGKTWCQEHLKPALVELYDLMPTSEKAPIEHAF